MRTFRDIEVRNTLATTKQDFNDLGNFLKRKELLDSRGLWFAGFDNYRKSTNNAVAENLFYGNKKLKIVCINNNEVFHLNNSKEGLKVRAIGTTDEKFKMTSMRNILYPTVNLHCPREQLFEFKVTKNKGIIKEFKKALKN
ncbi:hypothetical protein KQ51_01524 [Candidatus Izimaplasma bacterium HR1]|uniref:hypothetical protein n=1 Tax=Candidatus Izimoplasma sp. HR1 TaxID=1541959 RepID=UPI0004F697EF|nr:hypothetical protein KQ51_01524 [Candidatus Izimaplasma bacterium HR1]